MRKRFEHRQGLSIFKNTRAVLTAKYQTVRPGGLAKLPSKAHTATKPFLMQQEFNSVTFRRCHFEIDLFGDYCLVARTGYTGEDGFEVYCPVEKTLDWAHAFKEDCSSGLARWVGLAARDSLRLEAGFPLYGHELSEEISPFQAGLGWTIDWSKETFLGKESLVREKESGKLDKVIFYEVDDRRIPRQDDKVFDSEREAGRVCREVFLLWLKDPLAALGRSFYA